MMVKSWVGRSPWTGGQSPSDLRAEGQECHQPTIPLHHVHPRWPSCRTAQPRGSDWPRLSNRPGLEYLQRELLRIHCCKQTPFPSIDGLGVAALEAPGGSVLCGLAARGHFPRISHCGDGPIWASSWFLQPYCGYPRAEAESHSSLKLQGLRRLALIKGTAGAAILPSGLCGLACRAGLPLGTEFCGWIFHHSLKVNYHQLAPGELSLGPGLRHKGGGGAALGLTHFILLGRFGQERSVGGWCHAWGIYSQSAEGQGDQDNSATPWQHPCFENTTLN